MASIVQREGESDRTRVGLQRSRVSPVGRVAFYSDLPQGPSSVAVCFLIWLTADPRVQAVQQHVRLRPHGLLVHICQTVTCGIPEKYEYISQVKLSECTSPRGLGTSEVLCADEPRNTLIAYTANLFVSFHVIPGKLIKSEGHGFS